MDPQQSSLQVHASANVPTCCGDWLKCPWACNALGLKWAIAWAGPFGRTYHHGAHQWWLPASRHQSPVLWCLSTMQAAWPKQVWRADSRAALQGDLGSHQGVPLALAATQAAGRQQTQWSDENPRPNPATAFATANQKAYEEMMAREAQQWALAAAVIIEERMGHFTRNQCSTNCQCSASCRRSKFSGQHRESSWATSCHRVAESRQGSSQATSCHGGTEGNWKASWVTSHWRGATKGEQTRSPSSTRQKHWVTFTKGRVPVPETTGEGLWQEVEEHQHNVEM